MPKQVKKGSLASKLASKKFREAFESHKGDETNYGGGGDLPEGIEVGIAQLVECKFDTFEKGKNEGELYFYAAGIVVKPKEHNDILVEGLRTSIMEPLCETPGRSRESEEEHLEWILNELRKLGIETSELDPDDLETTVEALKEEKPYFRFRTWKGEATEQFPNPRVNHQWRGVCEFEPEDDDDVQDDTEDKEAPKPEAKPTKPTAKAEKEVAKPKPGAKAKAEKPEPVEEEDIATLGELADGGEDEENEEAQRRLTELAETAGIDVEDEAYDSWTAVANALAEAGGDEDESGDDEGEDEEWTPEKGEVCFYKPPKARKAVECEITAVFAGKETVNLKSLDDGKSFKSVPWDKLSQE